MLKALIVDDESRARNILRILIEKHITEIKKVHLADSAEKGLQMIREYCPHLVFLDIEMPFMDGFDLLAELSERNFEVIFTTAHDQYAIKAIRFSALDYLLKPINPEELRAAFERFLIKKKAPLNNGKLYQTFIKNLENMEEETPHLAIASQEGVVVFNVREIIRCEANSNYTMFYLKDQKKFLASKTLKEYDQILSEYNFCRVHKSHLVNFNFVQAYSNKGFLILSDQSQVEVSRRKKTEVLHRLSHR